MSTSELLGPLDFSAKSSGLMKTAGVEMTVTARLNRVGWDEGYKCYFTMYSNKVVPEHLLIFIFVSKILASKHRG